MSKINHRENAIDKAVSQRDQGVDRPQLQGIDGLLCKVVHKQVAALQATGCRKNSQGWKEKRL